MKNTLLLIINRIKSYFKPVSIGFTLGALLASLILSTVVAPGHALAAQSTQVNPNKMGDVLDEDGTERPKTTREWRQEARATEGEPLERAKRIVKEAADAVEDWAELYPDVAERTVPALQDDNS